MHRRILFVTMLAVPGLAIAQSAMRTAPDGVILTFARVADIYGSRLVAAFDSIPASRYDYRPMPVQQTIGYIAQHLADANYAQCERIGGQRHVATAKDSLADTIRAKWPKDTLVARLRASLDFCDAALSRVPRLDSPGLTSTLVALETDLAEHYSQLSVYMRLLGMVPPSALPPKARTAIELPAASLAPYAGVYALGTGLDLEVTLRDAALYVRSSNGGAPVRLWPETPSDFFVKEADAQITFTRDARGQVTGLVLHQYGRDRAATKVR